MAKKRYKINKLAIIGVGLMGGSIGLAAKKRSLTKEVVGVFRRTSSLHRALKAGAIDWGTLDFEKGLHGADIVVIATPVGIIPIIARQAIKFMKEDSILMDVGSVKSPVVREVEGFMPEWISFVGGHPMAGSEKTGVEFATSELFKNSFCILTKTKRTKEAALKRICDFWNTLGSKVIIMDPALHDKKIAQVSHLPHIVTQALCLALERDDAKYASRGFKDTTRIASSDPDVWIDIFKANRSNILKSMNRFMRALTEIRGDLVGKDFKGLSAMIERAKEIRDSLV